MDPVLGLLTLALANEIGFDIAEYPGWLPFSVEDSIVYDPREFW